MNETRRTAAWWMTSQHVDASAWRKATDDKALRAMSVRATAERTRPNPYSIPDEEILAPPTLAPAESYSIPPAVFTASPAESIAPPVDTAGKAFAIPGDVVSTQTHEMAYPAAAAKLTVVDRGGQFYTIPEDK
jgi:hypothetical protein